MDSMAPEGIGEARRAVGRILSDMRPTYFPCWLALPALLAMAGCPSRPPEPGALVPISAPAPHLAPPPADALEQSGGLKLLARFGGTVLVAEKEANAVAFSPDGTQLVSGGGRGAGLMLWDARTGQAVGSFSGENMTPSAVAFSPDGKLIAASGLTRRIALYDPVSRTAIRYLDGHKDSVYRFAFSPDSKLLASGDGDGVLLLWDLSSTAPPRTLASHHPSTGELAFSPDGRSLVSPNDGGLISMWDVATGKKTRQSAPGFATSIHGLAYAADGKTLVSGETLTDGTDAVVVRDASNLKVLRTLRGHGMHANAVRTTRGGLVVSASGDGTMRVWNSAAGGLVRTISIGSPLWSMALSADGRLVAAAGRGRKVHLFRTKTGEPVFPSNDHQTSIDQLAFSPDGQWIASGDADGNVRLRDVVSGIPKVQFKLPRSISTLCFGPDGSKLLTVSDGDAQFWDPRTGAALGSFQLGPFDALVFSPDGRTVAASNTSRLVRLLDATTGAEIRIFGTPQRHDGMRQNLMTPSSVSFSPDGTRLAVARWDQPIQVWEVETGALVHTLPGTLNVAFSPHGDVIAGNVGTVAKRGTSLEIRLWNATTGAELFTVEGNTKPVFSADGRALLAFHDRKTAGGPPIGSRATVDRELRVWSVVDGKLVAHAREPGRVPLALAISPAGKRIATAGHDATIAIFELANEESRGE
jgi:WD40 repeat protein